MLQNAAIIQGDGISDDMIFDKIYPAVIAAGFCPEQRRVRNGGAQSQSDPLGKPNMRK